MRFLSYAILISALCGAADAVACDPTVGLTRKGDTVEVTIGDQPFTVFHFGRELPKPYFWPVRGPNGTILTRPIGRPRDDHKHHKGLWLSVDEVNGIEFWAEKGKIRNVSVEISNGAAPGAASSAWSDALTRYAAAGGEPLANASGCSSATLSVVNHWVDKADEPVLIESSKITISPSRLIIYDITLTAGKKPVAFGDTKEGLLGFRMVDSMRTKERKGGNVENSEGVKGAEACWGKTSPWVDYYGPVDGKTFGVSLFDDPSNFRPSRYHTRDYGLFSISPFGESSYTNGKLPEKIEHLAAGQSLHLRYGIYIHNGDTTSAGIEDVYRRFVQ